MIKKSGKRSCCVRGGAWFNKCGDAGDTQFDHTWTDGINACRDLVPSASAELPLEGMFRHAGVVVYPLNTTQLRNTSHQQLHIDQPRNISNAGATTHLEDYIEITQVIVFVCASFIILYLQT